MTKSKGVSKAAIIKAAKKEDKKLMEILLNDEKLYTLEAATKLIEKWRAKGVNK